MELCEPCLDTLNHVVRVRARSRDHDPANHFTLTIEFRQATADVWAELHCGDVLDRNRCAGQVDAECDLLHVIEPLDVPLTADHELGFRHLQYTAADVVVTPSHGHADVRQRHVVGTELVGVDGDLVLLDEPADAGHFGYSGDRRELVLEEPVL